MKWIYQSNDHIEGWENGKLKYSYLQDRNSRDGVVDIWEEYKDGKVVYLLDSSGYEEKKIWSEGKMILFENNRGSKIEVIYDAFGRETRTEFRDRVIDVVYDDSFVFLLKPFEFSKKIDIVDKKTVEVTRKFLR